MTKSSHKQHITAEKDKVSLGKKILYGSGSFADMTFQWTLVAFALAIFNMELGYSAVLIGTVLAITRLWDAVTDPLMGSISDNFRSRFGRRRPFIGVGAVLAGVFFIAIWFIPSGLSDTTFFITFLVLSLLFYTSYTIFTVPLLALGYEMSSDFHERTKMMNVRVFANSLNGIFMFSWFFALVHSDFWSGPSEGIRMVGLGFGLIMIVLGLIPALTLKEKTKSYVKEQEKINVLKSIKLAFSCKPFIFLVVAFFMALFAYNTIATAYIYPLRYYVLGNDAALFGKWNGMIEALHHIATVLMLWPISVLSKRFGKRAICLAAPIFFILGSLANFFCYVPDMPYLVLIPRFLVAVGIAGLFVLVQSMIADVVDYDEIKTGTRREGMFGAIFSWVLKLALAVALFINGYIIDGLGVDNDLGVNQPEGSMETIVNLLGIVPIIGAIVAFYCIYKYTLTEDKMYEMRAELEKRRGVN
jgi:GPH family glycoside/pentoside/hexuronide:cation symporter